MNKLKQQRGHLLVTVVVLMFLVAAIALLLGHGSAISANNANSELEVTRVDYLAQAAMNHALWRSERDACGLDLSIPATPLGPDRYAATATGGVSTKSYSLSVDQDAWISNDDPDEATEKEERQ